VLGRINLVRRRASRKTHEVDERFASGFERELVRDATTAQVRQSWQRGLAAASSGSILAWRFTEGRISGSFWEFPALLILFLVIGAARVRSERKAMALGHPPGTVRVFRVAEVPSGTRAEPLRRIPFWHNRRRRPALKIVAYGDGMVGFFQGKDYVLADASSIVSVAVFTANERAVLLRLVYRNERVAQYFPVRGFRLR
jgi:hypothetical protein